MSGIESITSKVFIPDPSNCSSDGNAKLFPDDIAEYGWTSTAAPDSLPYIIEADDTRKYGEGLLNHGVANAPENNEKAIEYARYAMQQNTYGTNPFQPNDLNKTIQQQIAQREGFTVGTSIFKLA